MASDTATNSSRSALLQALSTYKNVSNQETTTRADYVGGLVGRNGKNAVLTWDKNANTVQIGAVICGNDFVGGLVGFASGCKLENCTTQKGYVLGRCFVGGMAGGFSGSQLEITGGSNSSTGTDEDGKGDDSIFG